MTPHDSPQQSMGQALLSHFYTEAPRRWGLGMHCNQALFKPMFCLTLKPILPGQCYQLRYQGYPQAVRPMTCHCRPGMKLWACQSPHHLTNSPGAVTTCCHSPWRALPGKTLPSVSSKSSVCFGYLKTEKIPTLGGDKHYSWKDIYSAWMEGVFEPRFSTWVGVC